jgi:hypothetical protein
MVEMPPMTEPSSSDAPPLPGALHLAKEALLGIRTVTHL